MALQLLKNGSAVGSAPWSSSQLQSYNPYLQMQCHQTSLCSASVARAWSIVERIPSVFEHAQDEIHLS